MTRTCCGTYSADRDSILNPHSTSEFPRRPSGRGSVHSRPWSHPRTRITGKSMAPHADETHGSASSHTLAPTPDDATAAVSSRNEPGYDDYIQWKTLPPSSGVLNRWSHSLTREHDFPGAQVSLQTSYIFLINIYIFLQNKIEGCHPTSSPAYLPAPNPDASRPSQGGAKTWRSSPGWETEGEEPGRGRAVRFWTNTGCLRLCCMPRASPMRI